MKKITILLLFLVGGFTTLFSQIPLTTAPSGGNKKAWTGEQIGLTKVSIHYDRPGVKGREGKIWGQLVHTGFMDQGFGSAKQAPWRAGANENTTIEFSTDVRINGQPLPAGKYGFFIAYDPKECTLIFSKNADSWGSYYYDAKEDALRVNATPLSLDKSVEWLRYDFSQEKENSAVVTLSWEKLSIPFTIEVNYVKDQIESFRRELRSDRGFIWQGWQQAAQWCLQRNVNLDQALQWADSASSTSFGGNKEFSAWAVKAQLLNKLGRGSEAAAVMKQALPLGSITDLHQYGRQLLQMKQPQEALEVFKMNYQKNPNQFTTLVGLTRGYSATGDFKNALKYAQQALPLAPDSNNKSSIQTMIDKLKANQDVNQQ